MSSLEALNFEFVDQNDTSFFTPYNSVYSYTSENGKLTTIFNNSGNAQGALELIPELSALNNTLSFTLTNIQDSSTNYEHGGCWISNINKTEWIRFSFHNNSIQITKIPVNKTPSNPGTWDTIVEVTREDLSLSLNQPRVLELKFLNGNITFYVDNTLIGTVDFNFDSFLFYVFGYRNTLTLGNFSFSNSEELKSSYRFWRISNIKNRRSDQTYRSVGNIAFKTKEGTISDNPSLGFSQSQYSAGSSPDKAFDGLNTTYTGSASLANGTNTEANGSKWWIGYDFESPVSVESVDISMRFDIGTESYKYGGDYLGQEWTYFQVDASENGIDWSPVYYCSQPKIFKNDNSIHSYTLKLDSIKAKFWRIINIQNNYGSNTVSASIAKFNTDLNLDPIGITSTSYGSSYDSSSILNLLDNNSQTRWRNNSVKNEAIDYEYETEVSILSLNLQMRQDMESSWGEEWQTLDIFYSDNGTYWNYFGNSKPQIPRMDLTLKANIPVGQKETSFLEYTNDLESSSYKFWRLSNILMSPAISSNTNFFHVSFAKINFINKENLTLNNIENTFSTSNVASGNYDRSAKYAFDGNLQTHAHSNYASIEGLSLYYSENYKIGCMFSSPVEVTDIGVQARHDLTYDWGETVEKLNVEYSPNGFDWYVKGYCRFNIPRSNTDYFQQPIAPIQPLEKHTYWRVSEVFTKSIGVTLRFSGWELRFNTLTGALSNESYRGFSESSYSSFWTPDHAFDANAAKYNSGGFHPISGQTDPYYIGYKFDTPQHVDSISVLMRRDADYADQYWMFAKVEASDDGINWMFKGYAEVNAFSNTRFFTGILKDKSPIELLNAKDFNSIYNLKFSSNPMPSFFCNYLPLTIESLNAFSPESNGTVTGQVLEMNVPVIREVALYERRTRKLISITWSNALGFYEFKSLDPKKTYYVHAIDSNKMYNAVTKDMIEPLK